MSQNNIEGSKKIDHSHIPPEVGLQKGVTIDGEPYSPSIKQLIAFFGRQFFQSINHSAAKLEHAIFKNKFKTLDHGEVYNYTDHNINRIPTKVMSIDRGAMCIADTSNVIHVFSVERGSYLFVKPGCPILLCNSLERDSKIYVPKGMPVYLGSMERYAEVIEYDADDAEQTLAQVEGEQRRQQSDEYRSMRGLSGRDMFDRNPKAIKKKPENITYSDNLINIGLDHGDTQTLDINESNYPFIHVALGHDSELKVGSSTGKVVSIFVEGISHGSTLICDASVTNIYVKDAHCRTTIKCSPGCTIDTNDKLVNLDNKRDIKIIKDDFNATVGLQAPQLENNSEGKYE